MVPRLTCPICSPGLFFFFSSSVFLHSSRSGFYVEDLFMNGNMDAAFW